MSNVIQFPLARARVSRQPQPKMTAWKVYAQQIADLRLDIAELLEDCPAESVRTHLQAARVSISTALCESILQGAE